MVAAKAQWVARAGILPGEAMADYTRGWSYTSIDYANDGYKRGDRFFTIQREAREYAGQLEAGGHNWVQLDYLWF